MPFPLSLVCFQALLESEYALIFRDPNSNIPLFDSVCTKCLTDEARLSKLWLVPLSLSKHTGNRVVETDCQASRQNKSLFPSPTLNMFWSVVWIISTNSRKNHLVFLKIPTLFYCSMIPALPYFLARKLGNFS